MPKTMEEIIRQDKQAAARSLAPYEALANIFIQSCTELTALAHRAGIKLAFNVAAQPQCKPYPTIAIQIEKGQWPSRCFGHVKITDESVKVNASYDYNIRYQTGSKLESKQRLFSPMLLSSIYAWNGNAGYRPSFGDSTPEARLSDLQKDFKDFIFGRILTPTEARKIEALVP